MTARGLAVVTGASTGIGYELAKCCAEDGFDLLLCSNEPEGLLQSNELRHFGGNVETLVAELSTQEGVEQLWRRIGQRPVAALLANAGRGLGDAFLEQEFFDIREVIDLNITYTVLLIHKIANTMRERGEGRILITGSIAGLMPGSYQAVYNGTKAFLDSFSYALRNELKDEGVTVTCLMPGPTDTAFFKRAGMEDTPVGEDEHKADPAKAARDGYHAMMKGDAGVVSGFMNKVQAAFAGVIPDKVLAEMHRHMAEPGR